MFVVQFLLTREISRGILGLHDDFLPDDDLLLHVQRCVLYATHLWPGEFPDLD